jgi:phage recombination protein Bet
MVDLMEIENKFNVNGEEVKLTGSIVKTYLTRGDDTVSDQEVVMFINLCKYQKLNPFLNEAFLVKFKGSPAQVITAKEAYMKKAERNEDFEGFKAGLIVQRDNEIMEIEGSFALKTDIVLGGWAEVYKKNRKFPYVAKVSLEEYNKGKSTWAQKPKTMIRKTAIVQALREAFPEDLGDLYTEEEQGVPIKDVAYEVKEEIDAKANSKLIDIGQASQNISKVQVINTEQSIVEGPGF